MDVRTGSKSWGYSKRPRNWKKIMYRDLPDEPEREEIPEIEEVEEIPEVEEIIPKIDEKPKIGRGLESEARIGATPTTRGLIEKPKITARVSKPVPRPLVDPASLTLHDPVLPASLLDPALLDSSGKEYTCVSGNTSNLPISSNK